MFSLALPLSAMCAEGSGLDEVRASVQGAYGARFQKLASTIQAKGRELSEGPESFLPDPTG